TPGHQPSRQRLCCIGAEAGLPDLRCRARHSREACGQDGVVVRPMKYRNAMISREIRISVVFVALASVSACTTGSSFSPIQTLTHGSVIDQQQIDSVPVGSSREQVLLALGTPSTTATFDNEVFYYISQKRYRPVAFAKPKLIEQRVLAVYFGED